MFNFAKRKEKGPLGQEKALIEYNKDNNLTETEITSNISGMLEKNRKNDDGIIITEKQMTEARKEESPKETVEAQFDKRKSYVIHRRKQDNNTNVKDIDILSRSYDKKKEDDIIKAESEQDINNKYWDKYVKEQLLFENTVSPSNIVNNKLTNNPERFKSIFDFGFNVNDNIDSYNKKLNIVKMSEKEIEENIKIADSLIFGIYYNNIVNKKANSDQDENQIKHLSNVKSFLLAQLSDNFKEKREILDKTTVIKDKDKSKRDTDFHDGNPDVEKPFASDDLVTRKEEWDED